MNPNVIEYASEEIVVMYFSPYDNKYHRYYIDFYALFRKKDGTTKRYLIEIKPLKQTRPPKEPKRITKRYLQEQRTFVINNFKWNAAKEFAKKNNAEFIIMTEKDLF